MTIQEYIDEAFKHLRGAHASEQTSPAHAGNEAIEQLGDAIAALALAVQQLAKER